MEIKMRMFVFFICVFVSSGTSADLNVVAIVQIFELNSGSDRR